VGSTIATGLLALVANFNCTGFVKHSCAETSFITTGSVLNLRSTYAKKNDFMATFSFVSETAKKNISTFLFLQKYDEAEKGEMLQKRR
jgi:hypothetical protein